ncbi:MAG: hypothetical protein FWD78_13110 [Treponema sp.]|nr:hypothetical protein [Treponema sp.]
MDKGHYQEAGSHQVGYKDGTKIPGQAKVFAVTNWFKSQSRGGAVIGSVEEYIAGCQEFKINRTPSLQLFDDYNCDMSKLDSLSKI